MSEYALTLAQLRTDTLLHAEDPAGDRYTNTRLDLAIAEAILDTAMVAQLTVQTVPITLLTGVWAYSLADAAAVAGLDVPLAVLRVGAKDVNAKTLPALEHGSLARIDGYGRSRLEEGRPWMWYRDGLPPDLVGVWYVPPDDLQGTLQVDCLTYPAVPAAEATALSSAFPPQTHDGIAVLAAALLLAESQEMDDLAAAGKFLELSEDLIRRAGGIRSQAVHSMYAPFTPR